MMTRRRFDMELEELRPELAILRNAIDEVRASEKLRAVLRVVLAVGNRLNAATFRGDAGGFQLEALLKVCQIARLDYEAEQFSAEGHPRKQRQRLNCYPSSLHCQASYQARRRSCALSR